MGTRLSRRHLLRGLGGIGIGLPLMEIMLDGKAFAQSSPNPPKRYMVFFDGQSLGGDDDPIHNQFVPNTIGRNYDLKTALVPLGALKDDVSVISNLKIPWAGENGGSVPAGGRRDAFHVNTISPLLSGMRDPGGTRCDGPTSDQLVANAIAGSTAFPTLTYRVQADWYLSVSAPYGREAISYKRDTSNRVVVVPPQTSPRQAWNALFSNFTPMGVDPATAARIDRDLRARKSVLDLVRGDTERLVVKLGAADKIRLQRHLDELRDLERRVATIAPPQTSVCMPPADPGADPSVGSPQGNDGTNNTYMQNLGYSNEQQRALLFVDLIHLAMVCDLTRVATLQLTMFQSHLNMFSLTQQATDCHELGHHGIPGSTTAAVSGGIAWHVQHFARMIQKLKDTPEGNGNMLDNSALVFLTEGGHGFDPETNEQNSAHSSENMAVLLAGRAGGLQPGQHVRTNQLHPANVLVTAMKAVGVQTDTLGEVTGDIPQLRMQ
ncbi:MAG: DUF1552 domain-containing protein [Archangium sp.]|nr:DUF1552 domain-containing protein [Archangium sp.]